MGRRILAFFLGMIFGIVVLLGAIAGVVYFAATNVTPSDIYPESDRFLGDLANMSLLDIYNAISELYKSKIGVRGDNGLFYTLGEFLEKYNIDAEEAFGVELDQDILDIPIFEFFGGDTDAALEQIKVSALFQIANIITGATDEEGTSGGFFTAETIDKMRNYSMADLLNEEKGVPYVFEFVTLSEVLIGVFPSEQSGDNAIMWALGQTSIGRLANGLGDNVLLQFRHNGVFETVGALQLALLFGEGSSILNVILGDNTFGDLIDENGNINVDELMSGIFLGELLGLHRNKIADTDSYETAYSNENREVKQKSENGETVYVIVIDDVAYEAKLFCTAKDEEHIHDASCFTYVWYNSTDDVSTGIYNAIADITIADVMSGNSNALIDKIMDVKLKDLLDGQEVSGLIESIGDMTLRELVTDGVDNVYLGTIFNNERKPITDNANYKQVTNADGEVIDGVLQDVNGALIKEENGDWYEGKVKCGNKEHKHDELCDPLKNESYVCGLVEHTHSESCYGFVWYVNSNFDSERTGAQGFLCNFKLKEINSINALVQSMTLGDVMSDIPPMLDALKDTRIGDFDTAIKDTYLGAFLEYSRKSRAPIDETPTIVYATNSNGELDKAKFGYYMYPNGAGVLLSTNGRDYYEGRLQCEEEHEHSSNCYAFVWFNSNGDEVEGMMSKLAGEKIGDLDKLFDKIQTYTLKDVLGDNVPQMLKSLENTPIGQLGDAIEDMYLGDFLGYEKRSAPDADGDYAWYKLECQHPNAHTTEHTDDCYVVVDGLMGRMSDMKISEISAESIKDMVNDTPLRDVMDLDSHSNGLLRELGDTKIGELSSELDALYVGIAMGYHRNELEYAPENEPLVTDNVHANGNAIYQEGESYYFFDAKRNKYYEAQLTCVDVEHKSEYENLHGFTCFGFVWYNCSHFDEGKPIHDKDTIVKGLNGKMSNLRIDELSGSNVSKISQSLTIGDLIDSGMMSLGDSEKENTYKFAIICCKDDSHAISEFNPLGDGYKCNLKDYYSYQVAQTTSVTAEEYWLKTHGFTSENELGEADIAHRDEWRNYSLTNFISTLLGAM